VGDDDKVIIKSRISHRGGAHNGFYVYINGQRYHIMSKNRQHAEETAYDQWERWMERRAQRGEGG